MKQIIAVLVIFTAFSSCGAQTTDSLSVSTDSSMVTIDSSSTSIKLETKSYEFITRKLVNIQLKDTVLPDSHIKVYDSNNKVVVRKYKRIKYINNIDLTHLPFGTYRVEIKNGNIIETKTIEIKGHSKDGVNIINTK